MKPTLLVFLIFFLQTAFAQSLDYISVRKKNDRVVKNFYKSSAVLLQTTYGSFIQGPVERIANDTVHVRVYDVRLAQTFIGSIIRDTITSTLVSVHIQDISRIFINKKKGFFQRRTGPVLMIAGSGYLTLNLLNGTFFSDRVQPSEKVRKVITGAGLFGLGYLFQKLFADDGFSKKKHRIVYVDL